MRKSIIVKQVTSIERKCCPTLMIHVLRLGQCIIVSSPAAPPSHPRQTSWGLPVPGDFLNPSTRKSVIVKQVVCTHRTQMSSDIGVSSSDGKLYCIIISSTDLQTLDRRGESSQIREVFEPKYEKINHRQDPGFHRTQVSFATNDSCSGVRS